ncbi:hypothetical protein J40TS1_41060 [Paenibacillus montaniterrae]|uniref:Glycoside hydrolase family 127 protein n=1 Tax=Paenibacillus montaniterrae TaxID=429341 RepID=A0A919YU50_9BACL|nr:beta-L-arabinofuranosidase domain-containing protein [Paenibacillus montaniterrae]GIP18464.1 hypothetical protein J40TS1_41060 [Paenibacillus montaniterrae]
MNISKIRERTLPLKNVAIRDHFWSHYIRLVREVVVPYQWEVLNDRVPEAEPSHAVRNFKIAAGEEQGEFGGMVFQDSDVAKWLEAVAYLLQTGPDRELEAAADEMIDIIAKAQHADGYLNTYFTLKEPEGRWTNLAECHELYCAGHMIEAAVAYYEATGKRKIIDVVCRFADYIDSVFGSEPGKLNGYDGHQEIELALVKLYRTTGIERYLRLSQYFLDQRGSRPHFYFREFKLRDGKVHFLQLDMAHDLKYSQSHRPVRQQDEAVGHAVRLVYMLSGMADVAAETGDASLLQACRSIWKSIVTKRMYITAGIGSMAYGESFTADYDLPSDTAYAETCASIGLIFFAHRMLQLEPSSEYASIMERALYNTVVSGMARDGKSFFYVNPLEVDPRLFGKNQIYDHVKPIRQEWFSCACCPPNIARLLASLGQYIYTVKGDTLYTHLYIGGHAKIDWEDGSFEIEQSGNYAWEGQVKLNIAATCSHAKTIALRIPDWCDGVKIEIDGVPLELEQQRIEHGYVTITRQWAAATEIRLLFDMPIKKMKGHPALRHTAGKIALQRGPFIYCLEEADNGEHLHLLAIPENGGLEAAYVPELLGGITVIRAEALRQVAEPCDDRAALYGNTLALYGDASSMNWREASCQATFIPYYAWANRGMGEMTVWVRERLL